MDNLVEGTSVGRRTEEALLDEVRAIREAVDAIRQALAARSEAPQSVEGTPSLTTSIIALPDGTLDVVAVEPGPEHKEDKKGKAGKGRKRRKR